MTYEPKYLDETTWRVELEKLTNEYEHMLAFVEQELESAPEGRIEVKTTPSGVQYSAIVAGARRYLSKSDFTEAKQLAQKAYYKRVEKLLRELLKRNQSMLQGYQKWDEGTVANIYERMAVERQKLVEPFTCNLDDFVEQWSKAPYDGKAFQEGYPEYFAQNGLRVRSKSEGIIVDCLLDYAAVFRYECPLILKGFGKIHPDFMVLNRRTGKTFIWEHFGKMDDWKYANDMVKRVEAYHYNGYYEGKNLIYTLETMQQPFGPRDAKRIIEQYLI